MSSYLFSSMCHVLTPPPPPVSCLVEIVIVMLGQSANYGWRTCHVHGSFQRREKQDRGTAKPRFKKHGNIIAVLIVLVLLSNQVL
jgi:hypothetical protein